MSKIKNIISSAFVIMFIMFPMISAGLLIEQTDINITKEFDGQESFKINVSNNENFDFVNVTFQEEGIVSLNKFTLQSGETKTITVDVISNEDYNSTLTLRGDYENDNIGDSNQTYEVDVNYPDGFSVCNLDVIQGDTVIWNNTYSDGIDLINVDTNEKITTIQEGDSYEKTFDNSIELNVVASWVGFRYSQECLINVIGDDDYVHRTEYDDTINFDLKITYQPTTIGVNIPKTDYSIEHNKEKEDILTIENTGDNIAKNINLKNDWFEFTKNNFDLPSGESKNIGYTIKPFISQTNQTNKTHIQTLQISGNFDTINKNFSIFIPYSTVTSIIGNATVNQELLNEFFKSWCGENFDSCQQVICAIQPNQCVDGVISSDTQEFEFSKDTLAQLIQKFAEENEEKDELVKATLENNINSTEQDKEQNQKLDNIDMRLEELLEDNEKSRDFGVFITIFFLFILCIFVGVLYFLNSGFKDFVNKKLKFHKKEQAW